MNDVYVWIKAAVASAFAYIGTRLGIVGPVLVLLLILMVIDYITGISASAYEKLSNPDNPNLGVSSKRGIIGILKKLGYIIVIVVALGLDWLVMNVLDHVGISMGSTVFFGMLATCWFCINEMISILENSARLGVSLPAFLMKMLGILKDKVESAGDDFSNGSGK